ncbi:phage shock protein A (IM30), suppresses sigma54-dependent transcription [Saprospira grandis DSM 2844]|uniref:Phage shock protein A (IM30), suppresses sigma54-dependent transcription n=1 Tax=Saprospira grandis DSM 2844 TaxID=694433 RepID=J1I7H6_9BACT|nr:PspA/IM30 family protein [Saprospira grandis]EJF54383.1 phage shock protein A (IM30), suppresses sigma54-dependent transcription [Saprospira grandis DSM 2844]
MWQFLKRLFRLGKAEANSALDKLENPIKMTKQGIRDLKTDLDKSLQSLAEVKAIAIRTNREVQTYKQNADDYEKKAMALLKRGQSGQMDAAEAERLATEALARREENLKLYQTALQNKKKYDGMVTTMEGKIRALKSQVAKWENELRSLEARDKVSKATTKLNKQLTNIDSSGTMSMLERMKEKVEEQESLAEAYGDMADESKTIDDEIDTALNDPTVTASAALDDLKRKMGMMPAQEERIEIKEKSDVTIKIEVDDKSKGA